VRRGGRDSADPVKWLRHARSDLALASMSPDGSEVLLESLCYHCQQAAEKALKAVLIARGAQVPRTHNIGLLLDRLPVGVSLPQGVGENDVAALSAFAVVARYPGDLEEIEMDDYEAAIATARAVVEWADGLVAGWTTAKDPVRD